jgi:hypothetical protein
MSYSLLCDLAISCTHILIKRYGSRSAVKHVTAAALAAIAVTTAFQFTLVYYSAAASTAVTALRKSKSISV